MAAQEQPDKQARREARQKATEAAHALALGDYGLARQLDLQIVRQAPDSDVGRKAAAEADNLRTDPLAIYIGLATVALYGLAWLLAL